MNFQDPSLREALARGRTLPAEWYTDPKFLEREKEAHLFGELELRRPSRAGRESRRLSDRPVG